jgi:PAS domain S-box-containing protein
MNTANNKLLYPLYHVWLGYKLFVKNSTTQKAFFEFKDAFYWQQSLFTKVVLYALPLGILVVIPSIIITYLQGHLLVPSFDAFTICSIAFVALNRRFSLHFKQTYIVIVLYILAVILIEFLGSFGIGSIYLLALSVFITLQFPAKVANASVVVNVLLYTGFTFVIHFRLFNSALIDRYSVSFWIGYALSFLFLNVAVIVQIRHIVNGLNNTLVEKSGLLNVLQVEFDKKVRTNAVLKESEDHYKSLFSLNPSPMWIFDLADLRFLQVNETAIKKYGFSRDEFLSMTIKDLRPPNQIEELLMYLSKLNDKEISENITQHRNKKGQVFHVEVRCSNILFKGKKARLVIVRNITQQIEYTRAIEQQNKKLEEIAFMQSHLVRAPLTRIMALSDLLAQEEQSVNNLQLLEYLNTSVKELDNVIKTVVSHSEKTLQVIPQKFKTKS